ncbi:MAG: putative transcriptional regulator [Candidatus Saccharibacteria bacterium]|nr:putative transcriptional regulator [Candidatus Saccharibacteria bacterium]
MGTEKKRKLASHAPLNKERIVLAAVKMADAGGIDALSMRKLGVVLGVEAMALYHHFANKEELIDSMVDSVHAEITVPKVNDSWDAAMRRRAVSAVKAISNHRWAAPLMESRQNPGPASMQLIDATVRCLRQTGFSIDMVAHVLSLLDAYTFGFAEQLRPTETVEQSAQMGLDIMEHFPFDLYPHVGELVAEQVVKAGYRTMDEFYYGLDLILAGITQLGPNK